MRYSIQKLEAITWRESFSEYAHKAVFNEEKPKDWDRIDYALLMTADEMPVAYVTCLETYSDTVHLQYAGVFPMAKDTIWSYELFQAGIRYLKEDYARCFFYVKNTNKVALKMAAKVGFLITGVKNFHGDVLLEHLLEFNEK